MINQPATEGEFFLKTGRVGGVEIFFRRFFSI